VITFLLGATVAFLPLLSPRGPGNTAPVDLFAIGFLALSLVALAQRGRGLTVPAPLGLALILAGSLLAVALSSDPSTGLFTLLIDVYLLVLLVAIASVLHGDEQALRRILVLWTVTSLFWAAALIAQHLHLVPASLVGSVLKDTSSGTRVSGPTNNNPNLAASYVVTSFFVLLASPWPRSRLPRLLAAGLLLFALYATASIGGFTAILAGAAFLAIGAYLRGARTAGEVRALIGAALLAVSLATTALVATVGIPRPSQSDAATIAREAKGSKLTADSLGRLNRSMAGRVVLWETAVIKTGARTLVGLGPGEAKEELEIPSGTLNRFGNLKVHSLHNDFLAFLIERGVIGLLGLLTLYGALLRGSSRLLTLPARDGLRVRALGAGIVANVAHSLTHETFHFRHTVVLFALLWVATGLFLRRGVQPVTPTGPQHAEAVRGAP
jgi:O-antigen ligase